jgi:uncharacterized Zn finger protein (UPF0148 family)
MKNDYSRPVSMQCSSCGGTQFEFDEDGPIRCIGCDRIYASKDELIEENGARIEQQVEQMKSDIMKDVRKDLSDIFKKFK